MTKQVYEIRVEGFLGDRWESWFEGLTIRQLQCGQSLLKGPMDQAMLQGVLLKVGDLGLKLISVQPSESGGLGETFTIGKDQDG